MPRHSHFQPTTLSRLVAYAWAWTCEDGSIHIDVSTQPLAGWVREDSSWQPAWYSPSTGALLTGRSRGGAVDVLGQGEPLTHDARERLTRRALDVLDERARRKGAS